MTPGPASPRPRRRPAKGRSPEATLALPFDRSAPDSLLSVTQLVGIVRTALASGVGAHWVAGEVSNLRVPPSGHCYFTLKDERAQIAAVMFRSAARALRFELEDGLEVMLFGSAQVYEARGTLQIVVDKMEPLGIGALQLAVEQLKQRLSAEGLFAEERKRDLPYFPRCVGVVTALKGAAVHDMIATMRQRMPATRILLRPVLVQGDQAPEDIVRGLSDLAEDGSAEVVVLGRGGGSIEDLWAFNDERVIRAIAACPVPVVSAVGHEVDWTLADLVADRRAATPTAAAALVVPDARDLGEQIQALAIDVQRAVQRHLERRRAVVEALARHVRDPRQVLQSLQIRVDELAERALRAARSQLERKQSALARLAGGLHALSPLAVLDRGYAILTREDGEIAREADDLRPNELVYARLSQGQARMRVEATNSANPKSRSEESDA